MPSTETTLSADGRFRFTVTPAPIDNQIEYFREEIAAQKSGKPVERPAQLGLLERRVSKGKWEPVWAGPLANPVAPVTVLVADDGRHIVTFDNWHSMGFGPETIAIYGPEGKLVRALALTDLMPQEVVDALPRSVSSISWRESERFSADGASVVVDLPVPGQGWQKENPETFSFAIALADGTVSAPSPAQWEAVLAAAARVAEAERQAEAERVAYLSNPLTVPQGCEERVWHAYLNEAHARLSKAPPFDASTWTTVLFPRDHPRHRESVGWLKEEMLEEWEDNDVAVASPCDPDGLVAVVSWIVKKVRAGKLSNLALYVSAPEAQFAEIARLVAPTGGKAVWLDPNAAIPQRPDRIPGSPERKAAEEAHMDALFEETSQEQPAPSDQQMP